MIKNNLKLILRNLWKNKVVSFINLVGLTLGIACSLLLFMYVQYEHSYDSFMPDADRIYRLAFEEKGANARKIGLSGWSDVETLSTDFAMVEEVMQIQSNSYSMLPAGEVDKKVTVTSTFAAENFFNFFGFPLVQGDAATALSDPSSIVLSESTAKRLFGDESAMGKTVTIDASSFKKDMVVTGIAKEIKNSHIQFESVIPWAMKAPDGRHIAHMWFQQSLYLYVKTAGVGQVNELTAQLNDKLVETGDIEDYEYFFQALNDIYFGSGDIQFLSFVSGNQQTINTLFYIAIIILLVACINYVNLQTAKGTRRSLEVGVRKVMGAQKGQLVQQFLGESFIITFFSAVLAVLLIDLSLPAFNNLTGKTFTIQTLLDQGLAVVLLAITLLSALVSGLYPAFVLSSFKPSQVLKSAAAANLSGRKARRTLILVQFGISIFLMAVTYITFQQTSYIGKKDLGFNKDQVITFNITTKNMYQSKEAFRKELDGYPGVVSTSLSTDVLGNGYTNNSGPVYSKLNADLSASTTIFGVDHHFVETYDMELLEGRNFDPRSAYDSTAVIVNEAFVRSLGLEDPLNTKVTVWNPDRAGSPIIGVIKDFHFQKLHEEINPVMIRIAPRNIWNLSVRMTPENIGETLAFIETKWDEFESETPFRYSFIDQKFERFYEEEARVQKAITFFSLISIVLTSLGLFGMTTFVIERKVKEIGIRKVLGASLGSINLLIFREFIVALVIAIAISSPLAFYMGNEWLSRFAYRIDINAVPFLVASLLTIVIIASTVSLLSFRAARANPVEALRNE
ncbi:MAG: FtsX-like permease family protein [Roseivirga sp.]|nr:FtsX-like permease family protein [Roseivirga sp.]